MYLLMNRQGHKSIPKAEYWSIHTWIRRNYGKASFCSNFCGTTKTVFDWALIHGKTYEKKIENFKPLCKKCHHSYDEISRFGPLHPMFGKNHSEESRKKMSLSRMGNQNMLGKKLSAETRLKMSLKRKGVPKSEEHKKKIGLAQKGKIIPLEQRRKISESRIKLFKERKGANPSCISA